MKIKLIQILVVNLVLGFLALGFGARAWAGSNPNAQSMSVVPEIISPTPTHLKRNFKKIKSAGGTESAANLEPTSSDTEVPTPIAISAHHAHHSKKVKLSSDADLSTETVENGLVPQTTSVATTVAPLQASATAIPDYEFNAVVVTGTKTKLKVLDSPAAVSVVPKSKIDQKSVVYFDDALTDLPGVQVSRTSKGGQSVTLTMRGIPGYDKNLVLLDGFTLNQPVNMRVFWNRVPTQLVDHVEIVRGPFSALYGKSALGGVVNIITKEPEGESFNLSENWDSTNTRVTNVNYQNKISDAFSFYLGAEDTTVNGYTDHQFIQASPVTTGTVAQTVTGFVQTTNNKGTTVYNIGEIARTVLKNDNISAKVYYKPALDQTFSLLVNDSFWDQPTKNQSGELGETWLTDATTGAQVKSGVVSLAGTGKIIKISESQFLTSPGNNGFFGSYLQYKGKEKENLWLTANLAYTYGPYANTESSLPSTVTALTGANTGNPPTGTWGGVGNAQADLNLDNHHLIFGGEYVYDHNGRNLRYYPFWGDKATYIDVPGANTVLVAVNEALFAQDEWKLLPSFSAFLGARLDHWGISDFVLYQQTSGARISYPDRSAQNLSPKLSLVYKFKGEGSLRASVGQAFNPPTIDLLTASGGVSSATSVTIPCPNLKPEKDVSWEVGGEYHFRTQTTVSATYFYNHLTDLIYTNTTINGIQTISQSINAGVARIQGLEGEINQRVFRFLDAFANYTRIESKFIKNDAVPTSVGKRIPYISRDVVNYGVDFKWKGLDIAPSGTYHSKQFLTADNSDTVNGVQGAYDVYTTFNVKIGYKFNGGNVSAGVDNIFDSRYYLVYLNPGRVYNVGARFNVF